MVVDFDASAAATGLSREAARAQMQGTMFLERRRADMARSIARHARLSADLTALDGQGQFMRAYHAARLTDPQIARAAWDVYRAALPINFAGISFAAVGFVLGGGAVGVILSLLRAPFRRRGRA